mmetsp:Transcript_8435/g.11059  ORF Transcript_8435/g.11059 Transcript_8435/m.11059 type:complete len:1153 (-) Transcript_8435:212-3670(-)
MFSKIFFYTYLVAVVVWELTYGLHLTKFHGENFATCADGSSSGYYSNTNSGEVYSDGLQMIVFQGGGACLDEVDCSEKFGSNPLKFSSMEWPNEITGETVVSSVSDQNALWNYRRWVVPYCSQDLYLGNGTDIPLSEGLAGTLRKSGSLIFSQMLDAWSDQNNQKGTNVTSLVVIGISAGAMGVLNHFGRIISVARQHKVENLRIVLDSPILNSPAAAGISFTDIQKYVDPSSHPSCYIPWQEEESGAEVPCCTSLFCMIQYDAALNEWQTESSQNISFEIKEHLLILNSAYDVFEFNKFLNLSDSQMSMKSGIELLWDTGEFAGARKQTVQSIAISRRNMADKYSINQKVLWVMPSCIIHSYFYLSKELEQLRCNVDSSKQEEHPGKKYEAVCSDKDNSVGVSYQVSSGLEVYLWLSPKVWSTVKVQEVTIKEIVERFVMEGVTQPLSWYVLEHSCAGPNCAPTESASESSCQMFVELKGSFHSIPETMTMAILVFFSAIGITGCISTFLFDDVGQKKTWASIGWERFGSKAQKNLAESHNVTKTKRENRKEGNDTQPNGPRSKVVKSKSKETLVSSVSRLSVSCPKAKKHILHQVSLDLKEGCITGLVGKSGCGKTTLLRCLALQAPKSLEVRMEDCLLQLGGGNICFLRQEDDCPFLNIPWKKYLQLNAKVYSNSTMLELDAILSSQDKPIKLLSGGQKRLVAITSVLLQKPKLILLDEPLSGLDSATAGEVMSFLRRIANEHSCSIVFSVHMPNQETINFLDQLLVLKNGEIIFSTPGQGMPTTEQTDGSGTNLISEQALHVLVETEDDNCDHQSILAGDFSDQNYESSQHLQITKAVSGQTKYFLRPFWPIGQFSLLIIVKRVFCQSFFLFKRLNAEFGISFTGGIITLPIGVLLLTWIFSFDAGSFTQVILATTFFLGLPVNIFRHKVACSCEYWKIHLWELCDKRISPIAYILASDLSLFWLPTWAIGISLVVGYCILSWSFRTFIVQYLFCLIYSFLYLQMGKVLCVLANGKYTTLSRFFSVYIMFTFLFGGVLVPIRKFPSYAKWCAYLSPTYWAVSGSVLNQLEKGEPIGEVPCTSLLSCFLSDPAVFSKYLGYGTTSFLSFIVLLIWLSGLVFLEVILTYRKVSDFAVTQKRLDKTLSTIV